MIVLYIMSRLHCIIVKPKICVFTSSCAYLNVSTIEGRLCYLAKLNEKGYDKDWNISSSMSLFLLNVSICLQSLSPMQTDAS